jgi:hypothetical protein
MPLIQGGPPEWIWERTPDPLKWELIPSQAPEGHTLYELRVNCGLGVMRLQFFTRDEVNELQDRIAEGLSSPGEGQPSGREAERPPAGAHVQQADSPEPERPPQGKEGVVSDPDFKMVP